MVPLVDVILPTHRRPHTIALAMSMDDFLHAWDERLAGTARGSRAGLLEALSEDETKRLGRPLRRAGGRGRKKNVKPWRRP